MRDVLCKSNSLLNARQSRSTPSCNCAQPPLLVRKTTERVIMGINKQSDMESNLQIGPTDQGMVR
ncbi:MAG: DUF6324 family protein, partial [Paracoccaceae bacterium]